MSIFRKQASTCRAAFAEALERRLLLAAVAWDGGAGDNLWSSAANWSGDVLPGSADQVTIPAGFSTIQYTAAVPAANRVVDSLATASPLFVKDSSIAVNTVADIDAALTIGAPVVDSSAISGGTWDVTGAPNGRITQTGRYATLANSTIVGDLLVTAVVGSIKVIGASRFDSLRLQGAASSAQFSSGFVLHDSVIAQDSSGQHQVIGGAFTIASTGEVRLAPDCVGAMVLRITNLVNNGVIIAESDRADLVIDGGSFTNNGVVRASSGSLIIETTTWTNAGSIVSTASSAAFEGSWSSTGTVTLTGGTLSLGGMFTTLGLNTAGFERVGGTVNLTGTLDNNGRTLEIDSITGSWNLLGGAINGGTINHSDGHTLFATSGGGTLQNVQVNGDLVFNAADSLIDILGSTRFTTARLQGDTCSIRFAPGYTLLDTVVGEGTETGLRSVALTASGTLTIGSTGVVRLAAGCAGVLAFSHGQSITVVNNGMISAESAGQVLAFFVTTFTNHATLQVLAGTIHIGSATAVTNFNSATGTLTGGVWSVRNATLTWFDTIRAIAPTTSVHIDGASSAFSAISELAVNSGLLTATNGGVLTLTPEGGTFANNGTLAIDAASRLFVAGAFAQTAEGVLDLGVGSPTSYGRVTVSGAATVGGSLVVTYSNYTMSRGDSFDLISGASVTGTFASASIGGVQGYDRPFLRYEPGRVRLEIIAAADWDGDGFVTGLDYDLFVTLFEQGENADFDGDGFITGLDFDLFVYAYEHG